MRTKKAALTLYSDTHPPMRVATRCAGEWHLHPLCNTSGTPWMAGRRDCYLVSHACGFAAYGPAPRAKCRKAMERLAVLPPCPVAPETARAMNKQVSRSPEYAAWLAQVARIVREEAL